MSDAFVLASKTGDAEFAVLGEETAFGQTVSCFLSMFDALIFASRLSRQDTRTYQLRRVSELEPFFFLHDTSQAPLGLHLAWPAKNRSLLLRSDGLLCDVEWIQGPQPRSTSSGVEFDANALAFVDLLRERAGLFAWRETDKAVSGWDIRRVKPEVDQALATMPVMFLPNSDEYTQFALYDPEFEQWHFVPRALGDG